MDVRRLIFQMQCNTSRQLYSNQVYPPTSHNIVGKNEGNVTFRIHVLTLRLLMSYIYGAPSKARNANVVYIWTYIVQQIERDCFSFAKRWFIYIRR